jgi:hypothetical protein
LNLEAVIRALGRLNIEPNAGEKARMAAQFSVYAKNRHEPRKFENDSGAKRNRATPDQQEAAARWAHPAYERLYSRT